MISNAQSEPELIYTKVMDLDIAYRVYQTGFKPWLLILHGWNELGMQSWLPVAKDLSQNFNVVAIDLPAFGKSPDPKEVWNTDGFADFTIQFISFLKHKYDFSEIDLNIVGHSFGGSIACLLASKIDFKNLVLVAPAIYRAKPSRIKQSVINFSQIISSLFKPFQNYKIYKKLRKSWQKLVGGRDFSRTDGIKSEIFKIVVLDTIDQEILHAVTARTLLVWGQQDSYTPFIYANKLQSQIPNASLISYPDINHGVHIHNQNQLVQDIFDFCQKQ